MSWNPKVKNEVPSPCGRGCKDRKPGCGASCDRWHDYVAERNAHYDEQLVRKGLKARTQAGKGRG